ncbi:MAG: transcription-repair coupling factor [Bacillota bacterium]|nr:transcription-repair coupling factor [Bacillota bacterium]
MQRLIEAWRNNQEYFDICAALQQGQTAQAFGLPLAARATFLAALYGEQPRPLLALTAHEDEAVDLYENMRPLLGERVCMFPVLELLPFEVYAHNIELISARIEVLSRLCRGEKPLVISCLNAVSRRLAPPQVFAAAHLRLKAGEVIAPELLGAKLSDHGYERVALTELPGSYSLRGSLIDVYPINAAQPLRIEFFDDEIESLRLFDPATQLSGDDAGEPLLPPAHETPLDQAARLRAAEALERELERQAAQLHGAPKKQLQDSFAPLAEFLRQGVWDNNMDALGCYFYPQSASLFDYFPEAVVAVSEPQQLMDMSREWHLERESRYYDLLENGRLLPSFFSNFLDYEQILAAYKRHRLLLFNQITVKTGELKVDMQRIMDARELPVYAHDPKSFAEDIKSFAASGYMTLISASSDTRLERVREIIREMELPAVNIVRGEFNRGFVAPMIKTALITEHEIFHKERKRRPRRLHRGGEKIAHFLDLQAGDFVVHITQGIGRYLGVERLTVDEISRDYLLIQYAGEDRLYLPVDQLDLIQKYVGSEGGAPKLNKLGGGEWNRAKAKARASVRDMAEELLQLYAMREQVKGFAFGADSVWQSEFEDSFPYEETADQLASLEEIKRDMESDKVMDRLLCGDVGFGKTEIALRAAFKAVMSGKQAAILVPTTVLAQQHYHTLCERFRGYPVSCACLSRFFTPAQIKKTLADIAAGRVDVVVGTHRLLSDDVRFHDLGLLIVDEEQRFGVAHKEKIKALRQRVDVLTLSATPIPRTLHMALVGMRDMSVISTPPEDRRPVQTYVVEYHQRLIRDAIARELGRGGQVFFVHNRIDDIYDVAAELQEILPQARVCVAHGQMKEKQLEQVMVDFVDHQADVLVCTTIIENGLDIANANTLIVDEADNFGLSQLYQLRGRVGRSERQGFAYFTYRRDREISDIAKKRLIAIRDFTELGAGFKIAMRDLELRGAGNILGPEQHGHIVAVGFDLYCRLLAEEMASAGGAPPPEQPLATLLELQVDAYIPDSFVESSALKVEIYKRIAAAESAEELDGLAAELRDRYGALPLPLDNLLLLGKVKVLAKRLRISAVLQKTGFIEISFADGHPVSGEALLLLLNDHPKRLKFSDKKGFMITVNSADMPDARGRIDFLLCLLAELGEKVDSAAAPAAKSGSNE